MPKNTPQRAIDGAYSTIAARARAAQAGGTVTPVTDHNALGGLQGGATGEYYHLSSADYADLTDGGDTTLHQHDHGGQDGLGDDDHTQYALLAGRADQHILGTLRLGGDASNYVALGADGHLTMVGTARVWDDIRIEPVARATGQNVPAFSQWFTSGAGSLGVYLYTFDNAIAASQKELFFTVQLPHAWAQTAIHVHVHWIAATTAASSKVRWGLEYTWAEPLTAFGNTTLIYADTAEGTPTPTGTTQYQHEITEFAAMTPTANQDGFSSILICRLWRDSGNAADTYTGDVGLLYIDAHVELNKLGSNDEYS